MEDLGHARGTRVRELAIVEHDQTAEERPRGWWGVGRHGEVVAEAHSFGRDSIQDGCQVSMGAQVPDVIGSQRVHHVEHDQSRRFLDRWGSEWGLW